MNFKITFVRFSRLIPAISGLTVSAFLCFAPLKILDAQQSGESKVSDSSINRQATSDVRGSENRATQERRDDRQVDEALKRENEQIAIEFVREHHAELEKYLNELKSKFPQQFVRASTEIAKHANRLGELKDRNPQLYNFSIEQWKIESRIKLLAIRNSLQPTEAFRQQLKELVQEQLELQHQRAIDERSRLASRLEKIDRQLQDFDGRREEILDHRIEQVLNRASSQVKKTRQRKSSSGTSDKEGRESDKF